MENTEIKEKAEFNMAVSYLNRLNALLYAGDEAAIRLDIYQWFQVLATLYRELSTEMTDEQLSVCDKEIMNMNNLVARITTEARRTGRTSISQDDYVIFHRFEMKLRRLMKDTGLQMKTMSDASKALFES